MAGTSDLYAPGMLAALPPPPGYVPGRDPFLDSVYGQAGGGVAPPPVDSALAGSPSVPPAAAVAPDPLAAPPPPGFPALPPTPGADVPAVPPAPAPDSLASPATPVPDAAAAAAPRSLQPGLGIPAAALDAAVPRPPGAAASTNAAIHADQPADLLAPDAITGVPHLPGPGEPATPATDFAAIPGTVAHYQASIDALHGGSPFDAQGNVRIADDADAQRYFDDLALRDPVRYAAYSAQLQDIKTKRLLAEQQRIATADYDQQQANARMHQQAIADAQRKSDALIADATRIANTKIDPTGGISTGGRIAGVLASIVGGLVQGRTGSTRNAGLDALNEAINRGIEAQKLELSNKRDVLGLRQSALAQEYARHGDEYQAAETVRLAALKHADDLLAIQQQNFAPRGTTFLRIAEARAGVTGQIAAAQQAFAQKNFENSIKLQDAVRQQQISDETRRHDRATEGIDYLRLDLERDKAQKGKEPQYTVEELARLLRPGSPIPPSGTWSLKEYNQWAEAGAKGQELIKQQRANAPVNGLVDNGGDPLHFRDAQVATKIADAKATVDDLVRATDELIGMIQNNGPEFFKTAAWRKAQSNYSHILLTSKDNDHLGVLSGSDVELESRKIGTSDPTELRDAVPGLLQFRHNSVENFNAKVRSQALLPEGRTVTRWEPPRADRPESAPSAEQVFIQRLTEKPNISRGEAYAQELEYQARALGVTKLYDGSLAWSSVPGAQAPALSAASAAEAEYKDISPAQRHGLESLREQALGGGPAGTTAVETLRSLVDANGGAHAPRVREIARSILNAVEQQVRLGTGGPAPSTSQPVQLPQFDRVIPPTLPGGR